jgi:glycosyltransferase involved in cell wall biosynthesis
VAQGAPGVRALVLASSYPRHAEDVAGRFVYEQCEELGGRGWEIEVLAWRGPGIDPSWGPRAHRRSWVPYAATGRETLFFGAGAPEQIAAGPWRLAHAPGAMRAMWREASARLERGGVDLVVGHWAVPAGWLARELGRAHGVGSLVVTHSGGVHALGRMGWAGRPIKRSLSGGPMTFVSEHVLRSFGEAPDASVLPMGHRCDQLAAGSRREWLCLGRLVPIKGVADVVRAFARARLDGVTLHVAGDGPERGALERAAAGSRVRFHGWVSGERKRELLERCGVSVFGSRVEASGRSEGLPVSLLECAAAGAVPLVAQIEGAREVLARPDVQRLPGRGPEAWARRMCACERMSEGAWRALERAQRARAAALSWDALGPRWDELWTRAAISG